MMSLSPTARRRLMAMHKPLTHLAAAASDAVSQPSPAVFRILDASLNRAGEGLRTLEDYTRFVLEDAALASQAKQLRHDLAAAVGALPRARLLTSRDTPGDVGTEIGTDTETSRLSSQAVAVAAATRAQQALRSIEEYGKLIDATVAAQVEAIRYRCYALAAAIEMLPQRAAALATARLYVLVDACDSEEALVGLLRRLAGAGVDLIQLRDKHRDDGTVYRRARAAVAALRGTDTRLIVNDRADIAVAAEADGVHVGQDELPVAAVRRLVGSDRLVGVSTHDLTQARQAVLAGADYIGCGPTFPSRTKTFTAFPGLEFLQQVRREISLPAFAIGGVGSENVSDVLATGFRRIAVAGAVTAADDPASVARWLKQQLTAADR